MKSFQFTPVDTLFFRGGTPFSMGGAPQENVASHFPPSPATIAGALRSALARTTGWNGRGSWPRELCEVLGDGPDDMGQLRIQGPFLLRDEQPLFAVPRHLLGETKDQDWVPKAILQPGNEITCDLGTVRLPTADRVQHEFKPCPSNDYWLTTEGMKKAVNGDLPSPEDVLPRNALWSDEPRIGLERDRNSRTAKEGMLYSTRHVRLRDNVSLGVRVFGLPEDWPLPLDTLVPFGGENRLAECTHWRGDVSFRAPVSRSNESKKLLFAAVTPLDLNGDSKFEDVACALPEGLRIVSACLDRAARIGGWDFRRGGSPLPMRSMLAPGSVLFCEVLDDSAYTRLEQPDELVGLGLRTEVGFGLTAVGRWSWRDLSDSCR